MKRFSSVALCVCSIVLAATLYARADQPTTKPSDDNGKTEKPEKAMRGGGGRAGWGFNPYNKLSNVTDEQKAKINDIHRKFVVERKALEDKQEADVMAVLTLEQKAELEKMKADEKAKGADRRRASKDKDKDKDEDEKDKDK